MAVVPFHERAVAHWYDEVGRARHELLASLDDLRDRADSYLTVSALATTLFAVLAPDHRANGSIPRAVVDHPPETPPPGEPCAAALDTKAVPLVALAPAGNGSGSYPDEQRSGARPPAAGSGDVSPHATARAITSPNRTVGTVGVPLSFTVTTTGMPVPSMASKGGLPGYLTFMNNGDGTATIVGTPRATGTYHFTVKCRFGKGTNKYIVMQSFTLTVRS
jgi:hypothetical protein